MRKLIIAEMTALLLTLTLFPSAVFCQRVSVSRDRPIPTGFCRIFDRENNRKRSIVSTAYLYVPPKGEIRVDGGTDLVLYSPECNNVDSFALVSDASPDMVKELVRKIGDLDADRPRVFRLGFRGIPDVLDFPAFGSLGWLRAEITLEKINRIAMVSDDFVFPNLRSVGKISAVGKSLKETNAQVIDAVVKSESTRVRQLVSISRDLRISVDGVKKNNESLFSPVIRQEIETTEIRTESVRRVGKTWIVAGDVLVKIAGHRNVTAEFTSIYRYSVKNQRTLFGCDFRLGMIDGSDE